MEKPLDELIVEKFIEKSLDSILPHFKKIGDEVRQVFNNQIYTYVDRQYKKNTNVKTLLHRTEEVNLFEVYYPLKIIKSSGRRKIAELESVFNKSNCVTIIGDAGSGKSTLFKYLFAKAVQTTNDIPIFIELRKFNSLDKSLIGLIEEIIFGNSICTNMNILERMLKEGKFIFFLDGFDELNSEKKSRIVNEIMDFTTIHKRNKYILSTRPFSNIEMLPMFSNFTVAPLVKADYEEFIKQQAPRELADSIIESINEAQNQNLTNFFKNPLLFTLYILTFQSYPKIPKTKSTFYQRVIDVLITEHDSLSKLGYTREWCTGLNHDEYITTLRIFSFLSYFEGQYNFSKDYIYETTSKLSKMDLIPKFSSNDFLYDMSVNLALWIEDAGFYSFTHRSIQEYFAALYVKSFSSEKKSAVYGRIIKAFDTTHYRESNNFLSICEEIDEIDFYKYLVMPILRNIREQIYDSDILVYGTNALAYYFGKYRFRLIDGEIDFNSLASNINNLESYITRKFQSKLISCFEEVMESVAFSEAVVDGKIEVEKVENGLNSYIYDLNKNLEKDISKHLLTDQLLIKMQAAINHFEQLMKNTEQKILRYDSRAEDILDMI